MSSKTVYALACLTLCAALCACGKPAESTLPPATLPETSAPTEASAPQTTAAKADTYTPPSAADLADIEKYDYLGSFGGVSYYSNYRGGQCELLSLPDGAQSAELLHVFDEKYTATTSRIQCFAPCGDWLVMTVGDFSGTLNYFFGERWAINLSDGRVVLHEQPEQLETEHEFFIADGWVYYNYFSHAGKDVPEGGFRVRPDGTGNEYLGDEMSRIHAVGEGYIAYKHYVFPDRLEDKIVYELRAVRTDGTGQMTLFSSEHLPQCEGCDELGVGVVIYTDFYIYPVYSEYGGEIRITFTVNKHGYLPGDNYKGSYIFSQVYAYYSVENKLHSDRAIHRHPINPAAPFAQSKAGAQALAAIEAVLLGDAQLIDEDSVQSYFLDYLAGIYTAGYDKPFTADEAAPLIHAFAVADFDQDGAPEVVVETQPGFMHIFRYWRGDVYHYMDGVRSMQGIRQDGLFGFSGGAGSGGRAQLRFEGGECQYVRLYSYYYGSDESEQNFYILGERVGRAQLEGLMDAEPGSPYVDWFAFDADTLAAVLRGQGAVALERGY